MTIDAAVYRCLYTKQKTQKRKIWHDGRVLIKGSRAVLHNAVVLVGSDDPSIDECEMSRVGVSALLSGKATDLEMANHLVTIEGPWVPENGSHKEAENASNVMSASMQKVLTRKFQKPATRIPPPPSSSSGSAGFPKRRRIPLQPGELQRRYYGERAAPTPSIEYYDQSQQPTTQATAETPAPSRSIPVPPTLHSPHEQQPLRPPPSVPKPQSVWHTQGHFDPNSFYGEDEEEEEPVSLPTEDNDNSWWLQPHDQSRPNNGTTTGETLSTSQLMDLFGSSVEDEPKQQAPQVDDFVLPSQSDGESSQE